jgi:hypothetical protein
MNQRRYIMLQLSVMRDYKIIIESRIGKSLDNNTIMRHWCKRYAAIFRKYVVQNNLID